MLKKHFWLLSVAASYFCGNLDIPLRRY